MQDYLAAEEPLEIQIGRRPLVVTMRTPGHDEELAAGFLLTEGIIEQRAQLAEITIPARGRNLVRVKLASGVRMPSSRLRAGTLPRIPVVEFVAKLRLIPFARVISVR